MEANDDEWRRLMLKCDAATAASKAAIGSFSVTSAVTEKDLSATSTGRGSAPANLQHMLSTVNVLITPKGSPSGIAVASKASGRGQKQAEATWCPSDASHRLMKIHYLCGRYTVCGDSIESGEQKPAVDGLRFADTCFRYVRVLYARVIGLDMPMAINRTCFDMYPCCSLAFMHWEKREWGKAVPYFERAYDIRSSRLGEVASRFDMCCHKSLQSSHGYLISATRFDSFWNMNRTTHKLRIHSNG